MTDIGLIDTDNKAATETSNGDVPCVHTAAKPPPGPPPPGPPPQQPPPPPPPPPSVPDTSKPTDLPVSSAPLVNGDEHVIVENGKTEDTDSTLSDSPLIVEEAVVPLRANRTNKVNLRKFLKRRSTNYDDTETTSTKEDDNASISSQESGEGVLPGTGIIIAAGSTTSIATGVATTAATPEAAKEKPRSNSLRKRISLGSAGKTGSTSSLSSSKDASDDDAGAILTRQLSRRNSYSKNPINENEWARLLLLFVGTLLGWLIRLLLFLWSQGCAFFTEQPQDAGNPDGTKEDQKVPLIPLKPEVKETGKKERIYLICNELKNTEEVYVARLQILVLAKEKATAIVGDDLAKQMFKDIEVICQFHKDYLLPDLQERMEKWEEHKKIGDIMRKLTPYLKLYTDYVKDFQKAWALVDHWEHKSSTFAAMIRDIRDNQAPRHGKLKVQAHMIEPVQRVPRYELLLRDYLKRLPEDAPDKLDAEKALESVAQAASHFEEVMNRDSRMAKLIEIRERLDCLFNIVLPSREFISENKLNIFSQRTQKPSEKTTFLFNDLFIVCSQQKMQKIMTSMKLKVKLAIDLREAELIRGTNLDIPYTLWIQTKENQVELCFNSASEICQWHQTLQGLIDAFTKTLARTSTCSSIDSIEVGETVDPIHEGYAQVSSDDARTWRKRWAVVGTCGRLCVYKAQQDKVPLSWIRIIRFNLESAQHSKKQNTLLLQGFGRKYYLHFDNQNESNEWFEVLQRYQEAFKINPDQTTVEKPEI